MTSAGLAAVVIEIEMSTDVRYGLCQTCEALVAEIASMACCRCAATCSPRCYSAEQFCFLIDHEGDRIELETSVGGKPLQGFTLRGGKFSRGLRVSDAKPLEKWGRARVALKATALSRRLVDYQPRPRRLSL